jgi:hypothetical protein
MARYPGRKSCPSCNGVDDQRTPSARTSVATTGGAAPGLGVGCDLLNTITATVAAISIAAASAAIAMEADGFKKCSFRRSSAFCPNRW